MAAKEPWGEHNVFLSQPITKLFLLSLFMGLLFSISGAFPEFFSSGIGSVVLLIMIVLGGIYSTALTVRVLVVHLIKRPFDRLLNADNVASLVGSYALFVFGFIVLSSLSFMVVQHLGWGYLTYGRCGDAFNSGMISSDPMASNNYAYFAAVTFFTIGYGDICPMGASKLVAVLTAFIGNAITVVLMSVVLALYLNRKNGKRK